MSYPRKCLHFWCQICKTDIATEVHHIIPNIVFKCEGSEFDNSENNLIDICFFCHRSIPHIEKRTNVESWYDFANAGGLKWSYFWLGFTHGANVVFEKYNEKTWNIYSEYYIRRKEYILTCRKAFFDQFKYNIEIVKNKKYSNNDIEKIINKEVEPLFYLKINE